MSTISDEKIPTCDLPQQPLKKITGQYHPERMLSGTAPVSCLSFQLLTVALRESHAEKELGPQYMTAIINPITKQEKDSEPPQG